MSIDTLFPVKQSLCKTGEIICNKFPRIDNVIISESIIYDKFDVKERKSIRIDKSEIDAAVVTLSSNSA
jgi:hypothetical protein